MQWNGVGLVKIWLEMAEKEDWDKISDWNLVTKDPPFILLFIYNLTLLVLSKSYEKRCTKCNLMLKPEH